MLPQHLDDFIVCQIVVQGRFEFFLERLKGLSGFCLSGVFKHIVDVFNLELTNFANILGPIAPFTTISNTLYNSCTNLLLKNFIMVKVKNFLNRKWWFRRFRAFRRNFLRIFFCLFI